MVRLPLRCGGKDRGLPPVSRFDMPLGLLLVGAAAVVLGAVLVVPLLAALALPRLLGVSSEATVALILAGSAAGAVAVARAWRSR